MTDEFDVLKKILTELDKATKMKNLNHELLEHLNGSIRWMLSHSEKYDIPLPKKDELLRMAEKADLLVEQIVSRTDPIKSDMGQFGPKSNRKFTDDEGNPSLDGTIKQYSYKVLVPYHTVW